ncbi:ATP-binding protein [Rhizobium leguminosarum]|uniref:AlbA family DNA-binding domain-containing protein n=1 Tax=Rhizobium leguminosarum TaxID=384 RepID=UPI000FEC6C7C|nr:ATP-binding protein [Rhizobium leguminosarum]RWX25835.1 ATP-binding protein [Rhizobium leguminosarum]
MAKRSITDPEIGLIKAMLARNMKNKDIQFYFNRQERAVNSGRITQIRDKSYGPEVPEASEREVELFLSTFKPAAIGAVVESSRPPAQETAEERARALFELRGRSGWFLKTHESEATECKEGFCLKPENRFADPLRSIAGLANNEGGFVFFGVKELPDGSLNIVGLRDEAFTLTDPAELNRCLAGSMSPVPVFSMFSLDFDGLKVGVIQIEKLDLPPIVAIKNVNNEFKEGAIYYRYVGETRTIKPGELHQIIAYREQRAIAEFSNRMSRVAMGAAATLDLDTGKVEGRVGSFMIGEELLPKIQFIREGQFAEKAGSPTLRLIGDVETGSGKATVVRDNVTSDAVIRNFLNNVEVKEPRQYFLHSAHSSREWQPVWYYLRQARLSAEEGIELMRKEDASYRSHREGVIARLTGKKSAYNVNRGKPTQLISEFSRGKIDDPVDIQSAHKIALAVQGIPESQNGIHLLRSLLLKCYDLSVGETPQHRNLRSAVFRAACRVDEILYWKKIST